MKRNYNKRRKIMEPIRKVELVLLNGRNICAKHRWKNLEDNILGPFEVLSVESNSQYFKLKLPNSWKIHPVFNIDLLERYKGTNLKNQVIKIDADGDDWSKESVIARGPCDDYPNQHVFLVKWKDFSQNKNTWETYENMAEHSKELLKYYYSRNPMVERDGRFSKERRVLKMKTKKA
jgi:hypothetical protein